MKTSKDIKKCAVYLRVEGEHLSDGRLSLDKQEARCRAFCEAQDIQVSDENIYRDIASGSQADRPGLQAMLKAVKNHEFETVVVYKIDRLARKLPLFTNITKELSDVELRSATEPIETGTPMGKTMLNMLASFSALERETIRQRTDQLRCER